MESSSGLLKKEWLHCQIHNKKYIHFDLSRCSLLNGSVTIDRNNIDLNPVCLYQAFTMAAQHCVQLTPLARPLIWARS